MSSSKGVVKGATVEVARGRKVPIGTTGRVIWVGHDKEYGGERVGVKDADGDVHWTGSRNCDVLDTSAPRQDSAPARARAGSAAAEPLDLTTEGSSDDSKANEDTAKKASIASRLIAFTDENFLVYRSTTGLVYGSRLEEPSRAFAHGAGSSPLMGEVKTLFHATDGTWPDSKSSALVADYVTVQASRAPAREVAMRSTWNGTDRLLIDTGDPDWRILEVTPHGWRYLDECDQHFRRSDLTAAMPEAFPAGEGNLDDLWALVNLRERDRTLVLALLITSWMTGVAQPVVFVSGPQDAGKTEFARFMLSLVDPVTIAERGGSLPSKEEDWKSRVSAYRCVLVDNASNITAAQSDSLCKVATGGESITRAHYTNDTAHVSNLQVPVWMTSIGVGALRDDLRTRMALVELEAFDQASRRVLSDLRRDRSEAIPSILGALLDLTVEVLTLLPKVDRSQLEGRLTDFVLVVRCLDEILGTNAAARIKETSEELAGEVVDADPVAVCIQHGISNPTTQPGPVLTTQTVGELHKILSAHARMLRIDGPNWPRTATVLAGHLKRVAPALAIQGINVVLHEKRTNKGRIVTISEREAQS